MRLHLRPDGLGFGPAEVDDAGVRGFHEHFDPWRAQVWLEVAGPGWRVPAEDGYREVRAALRARYPDRPFTSDWSGTGRFPGLVLGLPPGPAWTVLLAIVGAVVLVTGAVAGPVAGVLAGLGWTWPLARARAAVWVLPEGVRVGPAWAPLRGWHEVEALRVGRARRGVVLRVLGTHGAVRVPLPAATWPAVRARLRRLGGLVPQEVPVDLDERYGRFRAAAVGAPWGVLGAVLVAGALSPDPWGVWSVGGLVAAAVGFVGAAVEARLDGWRLGGIFWMTVAYGAALLALLLAMM
ncbi:MAG: hypothetical protein H6732_05245 [Alphaproteobacteria bacterium]|nr:hypothetical protein [Alphaproteobacteria bacterium]